MNGLIHPCTHPEDEEAPPTEEDMYIAIFSYLDRLFALIRPRKLLYMAIDGVAPRAKMNQQRSRRFRSSQEAEEAKKDAENLRQDIIKSGRIPPKMKSEPWDSNVITPGTPFMVRLAKRIKEYVAVRQNSVQYSFLPPNQSLALSYFHILVEPGRISRLCFLTPNTLEKGNTRSWISLERNGCRSTMIRIRRIACTSCFFTYRRLGTHNCAL